MSEFQGAIFDVDGVLVDSPHETAWRESLREMMEGPWKEIAGETEWSPEAFTPAVYHQEMSGKPRMKGARSCLEYFKVPDAETRAEEYAAHKQEMIVRLIEAGEFEAYPDALRFIIHVKDLGLKVGAASSSKNAGLFLKQIMMDEFARENGIDSPSVSDGLSLLAFFDADVSGRDFEHGKPHPDMFLACAEELGADPEHCVVMEDATSGVEAAKAGKMHAIGIARHDDEELLQDADIVVTSLDQVDLDALGRSELKTQS